MPKIYFIMPKTIRHENDNKKDVQVFINSPGGDVFSGFAIYDMLNFIKSPVKTIVTGFAASMGSIIMLLCLVCHPSKVKCFASYNRMLIELFIESVFSARYNGLIWINPF